MIINQLRHVFIARGNNSLLSCCCCLDGDGSDHIIGLINLREATLASLAEQVSEITGRTLVLDPTDAGVQYVLMPLRA